jgi:hypothetical protein
MREQLRHLIEAARQGKTTIRLGNRLAMRMPRLSAGISHSGPGYQVDLGAEDGLQFGLDPAEPGQPRRTAHWMAALNRSARKAESSPRWK